MMSTQTAYAIPFGPATNPGSVEFSTANRAMEYPQMANVFATQAIPSGPGPSIPPSCLDTPAHTPMFSVLSAFSQPAPQDRRPLTHRPPAHRPLARATSILDNGDYINQRGRRAFPTSDKRKSEREKKIDEATIAYIQNLKRKSEERQKERLKELESAGLKPTQAPYVFVGCLKTSYTRSALRKLFEDKLTEAKSKARVLGDPEIRTAYGNMVFQYTHYPTGFVGDCDSQYAVVQFTDKEALPIALSLNGTPLDEGGQNKIMVTLSASSLPEMSWLKNLQEVERKGLPRTRSHTKCDSLDQEMFLQLSRQEEIKMLKLKGRRAAK
ncbi:hypothetical protein K523DRAFT_370646 [Schizophyllum commune Tattone D]|nr:hypothetical protein K523DRAFT_370646 [Schizophyllum commune Tattone D]